MSPSTSVCASLAPADSHLPQLQLIFTRLLGAGDWSHVQLLRYLVSVKDTLSAAERDRLRKTSWLPREGEAKIAQPADSKGVVPKPKTVRYRASELYEPTDVLRELGLPLVDWSEPQTKWRAHSDEGELTGYLLPRPAQCADSCSSFTAKLLFDLGLNRTPPVEKILEIAAFAAEAPKREKALRYFLDGFTTLGYASAYSPVKHALPFVPAVEKGREVHKKPTEVFGNPEAALLGFATLSPRFAAEETRFGIRRDPPSDQLAAAIIATPPTAIGDASKIFAYLSTQVSRKRAFLRARALRCPVAHEYSSQTSPAPRSRRCGGRPSCRQRLQLSSWRTSRL